MSPEAIALAVLNAGRPTSIAVVYTLLGAPAPRRLLAAYVAAGLAWSSAVGVVIVVAVHGVEVSGDSTAFAIFDLVCGVAILGFAFGYLRGVAGARSIGPRVPESLRHPSLALAAGAGVATHLPGLFYLLGLDVIAADDPGLVDGLTEVLIFNAIWWSVPIATLVLAVRRPERARELLAGVNRWARDNERTLVATVSILVGLYFTAKGTANLV